LAGAITAAAVSFVLMTFASVVGLAVASPSPTWRDTSAALAFLSGLWILLVSIGSFALGGYLAGRVRSSWATTPDEIEFRDGTHGLLVWALAVVLAGLLTWATSSAIGAVSATNTTAQRPAAGEPSFLAYELDRLFRSERRPDTVDPDARAEAGRIIMSGLGRREIASDDRSYLVRLVSSRTGLNAADADRRVSQIVTEARQASRQARASAIIIGFMTAASLAAGAAAAWFAAEIGGKHRDQAICPPLRFGWRRLA
jgi:hypothetical protein